ncbi:hypothetical protein QUA40_04285 [Microcoleus sp. Pol11C3]|uniref:hypothetical protein n=1 Tax=Microcoleus sp. Pol11C3 TaxID=3055390 RepID=UPI002FD73F2A
MTLLREFFARIWASHSRSERQLSLLYLTDYTIKYLMSIGEQYFVACLILESEERSHFNSRNTSHFISSNRQPTVSTDGSNADKKSAEIAAKS